MPIPDYVAALRSAVGQDLLLLPGVTGVVVNAAGEVLLALRSDNGQWALISGILEPGEQPAEALVREIEEETGVRASLVGLASAWLMPVVEYPNGDIAQYLDLCFLCRHEAGEPGVGDDESLEVGWFSPDALPDGLSASARHKLERALAFDGTTWFEGAVPQAEAAPVALDVAPAVSVRRATRNDVPAIVALLADDRLGAAREDAADLSGYLAAFERIDADPAHLLVVADDGREVVGTLQLTVIPGLSRRGALRAQVEAVRVAGSQRGRGLGQALLLWAVEEARARGCSVVQLTTDKSRTDARRFYERLGFVSSHEGMKLTL
jgi:8-oxo-dGTP pyrophosphatase MutT (NUDIX family)/ribosomal protein S18 acetylase RimI-like enzyme